MVIKEKIELEPDQFIEFAEDGIFFCIKNEGYKGKTVEIKITSIRRSKENGT